LYEIRGISQQNFRPVDFPAFMPCIQQFDYHVAAAVSAGRGAFQKSAPLILISNSLLA